MTDVGELVLRIRADATELERALKGATQTTKESADAMTVAIEHVTRVLENFGIYLGVREIIEFSKSVLETADNIYIMSERTGIAASTLSALNIPLKQNGSSVDEFASSIKFMSRNIELASGGNQVLISKFDSLGLSVTKLKSLTPEEQFNAIAKALGGVTDQGTLTADAMAIMGRGAAALIPLIKETGGNIEKFTEQAKAAGDALTDEQIKKVHEFEDAWLSAVEHAKIGIIDFLSYFEKLGEAHRKLLDDMSLPPPAFGGSWSSTRPDVPSDDELGKKLRASLREKGIDAPEPDKSGKGSNNDLTSTDSKPPATEELGPYIKSLQDEADALSKGQLELAKYRAEKEGSAKALADFNNGLRDSPELTAGERQQIDANTEAYDKQKEAIANLQKEEQKHIQLVAQLESQISGSLADIALNYKSFGATVSGVFQQIAKQIIEMQITTPLVESLGGKKGSPGLLSGLFSSFDFGKMLGFADGGSPPVGVPSIVGENGPEIFVPNTAGTVIPNNKIGGSTVIVQQTINMSPGLPETVNAAVMNAAPYIAAQAHASVFTAIQRGGDESRIVGRRS